MIAQSNVTTMLVGKDLDILATTGTRGSLAVGQIGVFLVGKALANGAGVLSAGTRYTLATKNQDNVVIETPVITAGSETSKTAVDFASATKETQAVGFNGTNGSIEAVSNNDYVFHVFWKDNSKTFGVSDNVKFATYHSGASATQVKIAAGLTANFNKNFKREDPKLIKAELLSKGASVAANCGVLNVVNESKYIYCNTNSSVFAVGDYVRIGGTATTFPVYLIDAVDTSAKTITLNTPYQGASGTIADAVAVKVTAAAAAAATDAGIKLTAVDSQKYFEPGIVKYDFLVFTIDMMDGFGATDFTKLATGSKGSGEYQEVAQNEWFLKGNRGETWRQGNYPKASKLETITDADYDQISLSYAEANSLTIDRAVMAYGSVLIATVDGAGAYASLKTALSL